MKTLFLNCVDTGWKRQNKNMFHLDQLQKLSWQFDKNIKDCLTSKCNVSAANRTSLWKQGKTEGVTGERLKWCNVILFGIDMVMCCLLYGDKTHTMICHLFSSFWLNLNNSSWNTETPPRNTKQLVKNDPSAEKNICPETTLLEFNGCIY